MIKKYQSIVDVISNNKYLTFSGLALPSLDSGPNASWDDSSGYSQNSSLGSNNSGLVTSSIGSFIFTNHCSEQNNAGGNESCSEVKTDEAKLKDLICQLKIARYVHNILKFLISFVKRMN